jgi:hypothetical protein
VAASPQKPVSQKEIADALQSVAEQLNAIDGSLARLGAGLAAVKMVVAIQLNPSDPKQALERIQKLEENFLKLDPSAAARKKFSEVIEIVKMIEKHGGPKQA